MGYFIDVLTYFLDLECGIVPLLSMQCQKALEFHQKYLNFCSEEVLLVWNDMRVSN